MPSANTVAELSVVVDANTQPAEQGLASLGTKIEGVGGALQTAFAGAAVGGVVALGAALAGSVAKAADFEKELSAIQSVSGATNDQLAAISQTALQLGKDTSFSASEAAAGMEELIKAGVSLEDTLNGGASAALNLAAASGTDVAESAAIMSNAMNAFALSGADAVHIADELTQASNASATSVHELGYSFSAVAAVAHTVGLSFDDTTTALAELAQAGLKGSDAGTSLKTMLINLNPSSKSATAAMRELGIITADGSNQFFDAAGNVKSLSDIQAVLQTATANLTKEQKLNLLQTAFGTDALRAAAIMADQGAAGYDKMTAAMTASGTASDAASTRLNNLSGAWESFQGSLETLAITVGMQLMPVLTDLVKGLTQIANDAIPSAESAAKAFAGVLGTWLPVLEDAAKLLWENRDAIVAVVAAIGTFVAITKTIALVTALAEGIGLVTAAITGAGGIMGALGGLVALLGGPVTLIIAAVAAAVGLLVYAWVTDFGGIQEKTAAVVDFLATLPDTIGGYWDQVTTATAALGQSISDAWQGVLDATTTIWNGILQFLTDWWREILVLLTGPVGLLAVLILDNWQTISDSTQLIWQAIQNILIGIWQALYDEVIAPRLAAIQTLITTVWNAILTFIRDTIMTPIQTAVTTTTDAIATAWTTMVNGVSDLAHSVLDPLIAWWTGTIWTPLETAVTTVCTNVTSAWTTLVNGVSSLAHSVLDPLVAWWKDTIWTPLETAVTTMASNAGTAFTNAVNGFKTTVDTVMDGVKTLWTTMWNAIAQAAQSPADALKVVTDAVQKLKDIMPDWLIPHSPTPFEMGIRGIADAVKKMQDRMTSFTTGMGAVPGELDDWIRAAVKIAGVGDDWVSGLTWLAMHESSGVPTKRNPVGVGPGGSGEHAAGLMQTIPSTFEAYRDDSLPNDIYNPIANAVAAIKYIQKRYKGDLQGVISGWGARGGYAAGGIAWTPQVASLAEHEPEAVIPKSWFAQGGGGAKDVVHVPVVIGGRTIEELWIEGYDVAIRRGRIAGAGARSMASIS